MQCVFACKNHSTFHVQTRHNLKVAVTRCSLFRKVTGIIIWVLIDLENNVLCKPLKRDSIFRPCVYREILTILV